MKTVNYLLIAFIAFGSCRTVKKSQSEDLKKSFTSEVSKRDSINNIKIDGVFVRQLNANVVTREVSEFDTAGRITRKTKETIDRSQATDSGAVGIVEYSAIKEEKQNVKGEAKVTKLKNVERKVPTFRIIAGVIGFAFVVMLIGFLFKHRKTFFPNI